MMIEVNNLSYSYKKNPVLRGISFSAEAGLTAVLGPNGAGKSTLFKCMLGLARDYTGTICYGGREVSELSPRVLAGITAYIPQMNRPSFGYRVFDVVLMGASVGLTPFSAPGKREREAAGRALKQVGITDLAQRDFLKLSGGEQQLVLVARALAQETEVLVMDEPTASLDYGNQIRLMETVRRLARSGYTVLLSTHNPQHALTYADRVLALEKGAIRADGAPGEVLNEELLHSLYGVTVHIENGVLRPEERGS